MAGSKSNDLEDKILDHVLGGGDYRRPATAWQLQAVICSYRFRWPDKATGQAQSQVARQSTRFLQERATGSAQRGPR